MSDRVRANHARWRAANKDKIAAWTAIANARVAQRRRENGIPPRTVFSSDAERQAAKLVARKKWELRNREKIKEIRNEWRRRNKDRVAKLLKLREAEKPELVKARYARAYQKRAKDITSVVSNRMRCRIWQGLRSVKGGRSWQTLLGYTKDDLTRHLQSLFTPGMTWELFMSGEIEIDHRKPVAHFTFAHPSDTQFLECWSLANLRPLWKSENRTKGGRERRLKPSLASEMAS